MACHCYIFILNDEYINWINPFLAIISFLYPPKKSSDPEVLCMEEGILKNLKESLF